MRVRIIEDEGDIATLFSLALPPEWEVVTTTSDFASMLTPAPWEGVDAAVIDLGLPDVGGLEILRYLIGQFPRIRRVVLTAYPEPLDTRVRAFADKVLFKPCDNKTIVAALEGGRL